MMQANAAVRGVVIINPQPQPEKPTKQDAPAPLTLAQGVERMFDPLKGAYATVNEHVRQAKRYAEAAVALLDQGLTWEDFTAGTMMYLVRLMAQQSRDCSGANAAEKTCVMLYAVASWLRQEGLIPDSAAIPKANWKVKLREEWRALTGHRVEVQRPRHQVDEVAAIFAALPKADPRLRLLIELAAELRAGQAVRAKRSDLILDEQVGGFGLGRFIVHGAGKKHGETVDLHPELRALVDEVLSTGYLSEAEGAYQRGEISDYFLFPTGKLQRGAYVPLCRATDKPLSGSPPSGRSSANWRRLRALSIVRGGPSTGSAGRPRTLRPSLRRTRRCLTGSPATATAPRGSGFTKTRRTSEYGRGRRRRAATCGRFLLRRAERKPHEPIPHLSHPGRVPGRAGRRKLRQERHLDAARAVVGTAGSGHTESAESTEFSRAGPSHFGLRRRCDRHGWIPLAFRHEESAVSLPVTGRRTAGKFAIRIGGLGEVT